MRTEKIREELEKARQKAVQWQARAKDLERQLTEQENLEIIQAVRSITASPEELGDILGRIRAMKEALVEAAGKEVPQEEMMQKEMPQEMQDNEIRKETDQNEE